MPEGYVEKRRGELLGDHGAGRPHKNSPSVENLDESEGAKTRYRQIARHWDDVPQKFVTMNVTVTTPRLVNLAHGVKAKGLIFRRDLAKLLIWQGWPKGRAYYL